MEQHVQLATRLQTGARLRHTIQAASILRMNAEDLYAYLSQAAEANPMLVVTREENRYLPLHRPSRPQEGGRTPGTSPPGGRTALCAPTCSSSCPWRS